MRFFFELFEHENEDNILEDIYVFHGDRIHFQQLKHFG